MEQIVFWHRRDLRIEDNAGLFKALKSGKVQPIFIFDRNILDQLPENDQRMVFLHREIETLKNAYQKLGCELEVFYGKPLEIIPELCEKIEAKHVITNRDYEPYALDRDSKMLKLLEEKNIRFSGAKDQVIFEKNEVMKADGTPYTVFTPYMRKWKSLLTDFYLSSYPVEKYTTNLSASKKRSGMPSLKEMGFKEEQTVDFPSPVPDIPIIKKYDQDRDFPALDATTRLSLHLRFGTVSIRSLVRTAIKNNETWLNELIWREFYQMILFHFPHSAKDSFRKDYDRIRWEHNEEHFKAWCEGKTGYPLVDAGMREINATGFMHNRVRMVVASFLTKHLLIDWRLGEGYFAEKLLDYELASNVGGWQWAAGSGCDAAPYFRVFNPTSQQQKFDPEFKYIKKWVPELGTEKYPEPIIDHAFARERVLKRYKEALKKD